MTYNHADWSIHCGTEYEDTTTTLCIFICTQTTITNHCSLGSHWPISADDVISSRVMSHHFTRRARNYSQLMKCATRPEKGGRRAGKTNPCLKKSGLSFLYGAEFQNGFFPWQRLNAEHRENKMVSSKFMSFVVEIYNASRLFMKITVNKIDWEHSFL